MSKQESTKTKSVKFRTSTLEQAKLFAEGMRKGASTPPVVKFQPGKFQPILGALPMPDTVRVYYEPKLDDVITAADKVVENISSTPSWVSIKADIFTANGPNEVEQLTPSILGATAMATAQQLVYSREARDKPKGDFGPLEHAALRLPDVIRTLSGQIGDARSEGVVTETYSGDESIIKTVRTGTRIAESDDRATALQRTQGYWLPCKANDKHTRYIIACAICERIAETETLKQVIKYEPTYLASRILSPRDSIPLGWDIVRQNIADFGDDFTNIFRAVGNNNPDTLAGWTARYEYISAALPSLVVANLHDDDFQWGYTLARAKSDITAFATFFSRYENTLDKAFHTLTNENFKKTPGNIAIIAKHRSYDEIAIIDGCFPFDNASGSLALASKVKVWYDVTLPKPYKATAHIPVDLAFSAWSLTTIK